MNAIVSIENVLHELMALCDGATLDPPSQFFVERLYVQQQSGEVTELRADQIARLRELHERYCQ